MRRDVCAAALLILAACPSADKPAPVIDARPAAVVTAPPPDLHPAPVYDPQDPLTVPSLELSGALQIAPGSPAPKKVFVYISSGDCLDEKAPLLRRMPVTDTGEFLAHIVAQPGTELSLCAAGEYEPQTPTRLYGKYAKPVHIGPQREQEVRDLSIKLTLGEPRLFPTGKK